MREVHVVGAGTTSFGAHGAGIKDLGTRAVVRALADCDVERPDVDALYAGNFVGGILEGQATIGPILADEVGLSSVPAMTVEGACASSGIAFQHAYQAIASGVHDIVLVTGVESMTHADTADFTQALGSAADRSTEGTAGLTFPGFYGIYLDRYMYEYGATREQFARVAVKNRENGAENPRARFREPVTVEEVLESNLVADPLRLYDCCPAADGASAVVLAASDVAKEYADSPIKVLASTHVTGRNAAHRYEDLTTLDATVAAARRAYERAGLGPDDVDVVELHDCFTPAEVGDAEDLGFFEKGKGAAALDEGRTAVDGDVPINPSGGLLAKGHPVGATGVGQIYEVCLQLRGKHENQVEDAEIGLSHNLGGSGAVCTVTILGGADDI